MKIIRGISGLRSCSDVNSQALDHEIDDCFSAGSVITVGAFDGLHKGHQAVLSHVVELARQRGLPSIVLTLEPLPREYFAPHIAPPRLMSRREKCDVLGQLGIDYLLIIRFDEQIRRMEPAEFVFDIIVDKLCCKHLIIGDDFKFGRDGRGSFELLQTLGLEHGFSVQPTSTFDIDGERVSSTRIRQLLEKAEFEVAEQLLGRPYSITGKVVYGKQLGRSLGVPTANIELHREKAAMSGVYAVNARLEGEQHWHTGVANVGTRPTVEDTTKAILEVHLLDFQADLYGKRVEVQFCKKIRDEEKFSSLDTLQRQIDQDVLQVKSWFKQRKPVCGK